MTDLPPPLPALPPPASGNAPAGPPPPTEAGARTEAPAAGGEGVAWEPGFWSLLAPRRLLNNVRVAVAQLIRKPLKNFLILQGVIWGTALAVFAPAAISGSRDEAFQEYAKYHIDRVVITPEIGRAAPARLGDDDIAAIRAALPGEIRASAPMRLRRGDVVDEQGAPIRYAEPPPATKGGARVAPSARAALLGVRDDMPAARDFRPAAGHRYITAEDVAAARPVCVLEPRIARELFGAADPRGKSVRVRLDRAGPKTAPLDLTVVGVMEQRPAEQLQMDDYGMSTVRNQELKAALLLIMGVFAGSDDRWKLDDRAIHLPISLLPGAEAGYDAIYLRVNTLARLEESARDIWTSMVERGKPALVATNISLPFLVGNQLEIYLKLNSAIYSCCIIMGIVVVMNIMLVSVMERFREVGIRKVEGATNGDIAVQFLVESAVTCAAGALLGIPASFVLGEIWLRMELNQFAHYAIPAGDTALTVAIVMLTGLIAGILPAVRAARLNPVETLRYE
ncbi:MAG: ABC transporter permease [Planctomycetes bacterium]|nr:ABC transporter permease [Planctomycetota bacterium]